MTSIEDKISLMIPAYLRGDLTDVERREVEMAAAANASVAADIKFQKNLKSGLKSDEDGFAPGELGWAKLSKAINQEDAALEKVATEPRFWKYATAILAVATIGQAGVLGAVASKDDVAAQYTTVSEFPSQIFATSKVGFIPEVTESQLTESLLFVDATIVAGPSSLGLYKVQFESKSACMRALDVFETQKSIVDTFSACE